MLWLGFRRRGRQIFGLDFLIDDVQYPRRTPPQQPQPAPPHPEPLISALSTEEDEEIVKLVLVGKIASRDPCCSMGVVLCFRSARKIGQLTGFIGDSKTIIDMVPVDMVVNASIAAIAKHGIAAKPGLNVYHVGSSIVNPITFKGLVNFCYDLRPLH
ncbi:hypothetical protein CMV_004028 [Castanea mollissima]|uniref:Fatty acyl-CoA reductase n=1 Tax=Castanea mollissima TaxID=60419 RepID=A0A8J4W2K9_9ROSI|nr:hypothetical protein CMV_004028 [Castanea mollissima]